MKISGIELLIAWLKTVCLVFALRSTQLSSSRVFGHYVYAFSFKCVLRVNIIRLLFTPKMYMSDSILARLQEKNVWKSDALISTSFFSCMLFYASHLKVIKNVFVCLVLVLGILRRFDISNCKFSWGETAAFIFNLAWRTWRLLRTLNSHRKCIREVCVLP